MNKQHKFISHSLVGQKSSVLGWFVCSYLTRPNQDFIRAVFLTGGPREESVFKFIQVVGKTVPYTTDMSCFFAGCHLRLALTPRGLPRPLRSVSLSLITSTSGCNASHNTLSFSYFPECLSLSTSARKRASYSRAPVIGLGHINITQIPYF